MYDTIVHAVSILHVTYKSYVLTAFFFFSFSYFSRASLDYIVKSGKQPDILHIHNWETAIVAPLFWDIFAHQVSST